MTDKAKQQLRETLLNKYIKEAQNEPNTKGAAIWTNAPEDSKTPETAVDELIAKLEELEHSGILERIVLEPKKPDINLFPLLTLPENRENRDFFDTNQNNALNSLIENVRNDRERLQDGYTLLNTTISGVPEPEKIPQSVSVVAQLIGGAAHVGLRNFSYPISEIQRYTGAANRQELIKQLENALDIMQKAQIKSRLKAHDGSIYDISDTIIPYYAIWRNSAGQAKYIYITIGSQLFDSLQLTTAGHAASISVEALKIAPRNQKPAAPMLHYLEMQRRQNGKRPIRARTLCDLFVNGNPKERRFKGNVLMPFIKMLDSLNGYTWKFCNADGTAAGLAPCVTNPAPDLKGITRQIFDGLYVLLNYAGEGKEPTTAAKTAAARTRHKNAAKNSAPGTKRKQAAANKQPQPPKMSEGEANAAALAMIKARKSNQ